MLKIILIALVAFYFVSCSEKINSIEHFEYEPIMIIELLRHGDRTPPTNFLNEKWIESNGGGYELTEIGMKHSFKAGQAVAKAYPNIFKNFQVEKRNNFYKLYSTNLARTNESLQAHMLGLLNYYLEQGDSNKASNLLTDNNKDMFTNFNYLNKGDSNIKNLREAALGGSYIPQFLRRNNLITTGDEPDCPRAVHTFTNAKEQFFQRLDNQISKLSPGLAEKIKKQGIDQMKFLDNEPNQLSYQIRNLAGWSSMYKKYYGKLPSQITDELFNEIMVIYNIAFFNLIAFKKDNAKFQTTNISKFVKKTLQEAIQKFENKKQYYGYIALSAHESNMIPFQMNLGLTSYSCWSKKYENLKKTIDENETSSESCQPTPEPAANIIWELSHNKNKEKPQFYVRMQYSGTPIDLRCKNKEKLSNGYCEFSSWKEINSKYFIHEDYNNFCGKHMVKKGNINGSLFILQIIIILALSLFITCFIMRYKKLLKKIEVLQLKDVVANVKNDGLQTSTCRVGIISPIKEGTGNFKTVYI